MEHKLALQLHTPVQEAVAVQFNTEHHGLHNTG